MEKQLINIFRHLSAKGFNGFNVQEADEANIFLMANCPLTGSTLLFNVNSSIPEIDSKLEVHYSKEW